MTDSIDAWSTTVAIVRTLLCSGTVFTRERGVTETFPPKAHPIRRAVQGTWNRDIARATSPTSATDTLSSMAQALRFVAVVWALFLLLACLSLKSRETETCTVYTSTLSTAAILTKHLSASQTPPSLVTQAGRCFIFLSICCHARPMSRAIIRTFQRNRTIAAAIA